MSCTWLEWEESVQMETAVFREYLAGKAFPWDTCETFYFTRLYYLIHTFCTHTIYTHITHKCWGVLLRENPNFKPGELEIIIPIYLYTYACGFPQLLSLHFHIIERLIVQNTYRTLSKCQMRFWCCWEALEEAKDGRCSMEHVAGSGEVDKTRFWEALLE